MSRSKRKHSIIGGAGDGSEKDSRQIWHRRMRAMIRHRLHDCDPDLVWLPDDREASNLRNMSREVKAFFDARKHPDLMRK